MIVVKLVPKKPFTNVEIKRLAKENKLKVKPSVERGQQVLYLYLPEPKKILPT